MASFRDSLPDRTLVMGIINTTPDSFSDGGLNLSPDAAARSAVEMAAGGADIIDVGGMSTRPGSKPVDAAEEAVRVLPAIEAIRRELPEMAISVDTWRAEVAAAALQAGATMLNDVSALRFDPEMASLAAATGVPVCLMHMLGEPGSMQDDPRYGDVVGEVAAFLAERAEAATACGVEAGDIILDPGFGFGKTVRHNLELTRRLAEIRSLGYPVLYGCSRKSSIGHLLGGVPPAERLPGTIALNTLAIAAGADIIRVHDVAACAAAARVADAVIRGYED